MLKELFLEKSNICSLSLDQETIDIIRLIRSENVGPRTFFNLIKMFGSAGLALENILELSKRGRISKPIKLCSKQAAEKELELVFKNKSNIITYKNSYYSELLLEIFDFPPILTYKGNIRLLNQKPAIAIVGARNASLHGRHFASKLSLDLANFGYIIVSGLARGIDTAAHSAIPSKTIAVIAGGIDQIYPEENKNLYEKIANEGLIISEYPIGNKPLAKHFPQRNRLISGLSLGVIIIEATLNSGSLITAKMALEQDREIFAVPGFPMDPRCNGTNKLIREGAHIVESANDIIETFRNYKEKTFELKEANNNGNNLHINKSLFDFNITNGMRDSIFKLLSTVPIDIEFIIKEVDLPIQIIHIIILELELAGKIIRLPRNKISLIY